MSTVQKGNWDVDFTQEAKASSDNKPKTDYMDMTKPGNYIIRLVGPHIKCRKHFNPYRATVQDDERNVDPAWQAGFTPGRRYAINIIDRADSKLKVLEKGSKVFKNFANYKSITKKDPAGKEGPNFAVVVTVPNLPNGKPDKLNTDYAVMPLEAAPFTADEVKMIKEKGLWPLAELYKSTPAEKMKEMWDALPADKKIAPKRENKSDKTDDGDDDASTTVASTTVAGTTVATTKVAEVVKEEMKGAPAESDDIFAPDGGGSGGANSAELF